MEEPACEGKELVKNMGHMRTWCTARVYGCYGVSEWKSIRCLWPAFNFNVSKVGNRAKTSFWDDDWIGNRPLKKHFQTFSI